MKNKAILLRVVTAAFLLLNFIACDDDDTPTSSVSGTDANAVGVVFSYDKFLTPDDVKILSADTASISVSKDFLASQELEVDTGTVACIWRTIDTAPFIRIVKGVRDMGNELELTTVAGDMGDMFSDLDIQMNTELFVNPDAPTPQPLSKADNAVPGVNFNRYTDSKGVLHPAVIIVEGDTEVRGTTHRCYTAEELMAEDASFKILDFHLKNVNVNIPLLEHSKFFIQNFYFDVESSLNIGVTVKKFKLKKFETSISGHVGTGLTAGVAVMSENKLLEKQYNLVSFPSYTAVFWVGVIPVAIQLNSGVKLVNEAQFSAQGSISSTVSFSADYKEGVAYHNGSWSPVNSASSSASAELNKVETAISGSAKTGVYLYADMLLYGCVGPELALGPAVTANVKAAFVSQDQKNKIKLSTTGAVDLGGKVGAKLKIWKWTVKSWDTSFSFWKKNLWNVEKTYDI